MSPVIPTLSGVVKTAKDLQPEQFLNPSTPVSSEALGALKDLYDYTKYEEGQTGHIKSITSSLTVSNPRSKKKRKIGLSLTEAPLSELITENFDSDQIWEEVQLQNGLMYESLVSSISKLLAHANALQIQEIEEDSTEKYPRPSSVVAAHDEEEDDDEDSEVEFEGNKRKKASKKRKATSYAKSVVDDKFFNLAQMTEFLEKVESQLDSEKKDEQEAQDSDSENSVDLFGEIDEDDDAEENGDNDSNVFYDQFFDRPLDEKGEPNNPEEQKEEDSEEMLENDEDDQEFEDEDDDEMDFGEAGFPEEDDEDLNSPEKSVRFNLEPDEASSSEDEVLSQNPKPTEKISEANLSSFERRRKKIEENIKIMEEEALQPKGWQFQGEVTAERRPENSLLEEHLQFDHLLHQAPEFTAKTTLKLEDIIKQRIKDQAWDDVERKAKPVDTPFEYKNKLVLDSEKSKQSLAQIYEEEYISKKKAEEGQNDVETVPEEETKIQKDMRTLFAKLDALSNFHFTPKPASTEVKIVTNLPSIAMEEVAPVAVSDATLLAPQEIQAPVKGEIKASAERTSTDKKRERRVKKKKQHLKRVDREERARLKGLGLRNVKLADNIISKKKSKSKDDLVEALVNTKELKSSKAFFGKLQDKVQTQIKEKLNKDSKKSDSKKNPQAKRFKL